MIPVCACGLQARVRSSPRTHCGCGGSADACCAAGSPPFFGAACWEVVALPPRFFFPPPPALFGGGLSRPILFSAKRYLNMSDPAVLLLLPDLLCAVAAAGAQDEVDKKRIRKNNAAQPSPAAVPSLPAARIEQRQLARGGRRPESSPSRPPCPPATVVQTEKNTRARLARARFLAFPHVTQHVLHAQRNLRSPRSGPPARGAHQGKCRCFCRCRPGAEGEEREQDDSEGAQR